MKKGILLKFTFLLLLSMSLFSEGITFRGTNVENLMLIDKITPVLEADSLEGTKQKVEVEFTTNWKGLYVDIPVDIATTIGGITTEDVLNALEAKINPTLLKSAIINVNDEEGIFAGSEGLIETVFDGTLPEEVLLDSISLNQIDIGAGGNTSGGGSGKIFYDIVFVVGATSQTFASKGIDNTIQILKDWVVEYKDEIETDRFRINIIEHGGRKAYEDVFYQKNPQWIRPVVENYPAVLEPYVTSAWNGTDKPNTKKNDYDSMFLVAYSKWIPSEWILSTASNAPINLIGSLSKSSAYGSPGGENSAWGLYEAINFLEANKRPEAQPVIFFVSNQPIALYGNGVNFLGSTYDYVPFGTEIFKPVGNDVDKKYEEALEYESRRPIIHQKAEEAMLNDFFDQDKSYKIADFGTGSGCLLLSTLCEFPKAKGYGLDISEKALKMAKENEKYLKKQGAVFSPPVWIKGSWEDLQPHAYFDVVLANPPYIGEGEIEDIARDVKDYEPHLALFAENEGLKAYEELFPLFIKILSPIGRVYVEHGYQQQNILINLAQKTGLKVVRKLFDLSKHPRGLVLSR